jgi:hypothetical protein
MADLRITIELDSASVERRLESLRSHDIPRWRRRLGEHVAREVLRRTISRNPVETARARSAWVEALGRLGGTPPAGWQGGEPDGSAVAEGARLQAVERADAKSRSEIAVTSGVEYVVYLEYGTRNMAARRMVRRSLGDAGEILAGAPRLLSGT